MEANSDGSMMTFGGHLDVLRKMLFRIIGVTLAFGVLIFCFKDSTFSLLLAPGRWDFITYRWLDELCAKIGLDFGMGEFHVRLISTELSGQFVAHLSTSALLGLLCASPYIVYELFRFIAPALYDSERRSSLRLIIAIYLLFIIGVLMSYYVVFPISFQFLGTYQVAAEVENQITLASYISSFTMLTFGMGLVFQLPIIVYFLAKSGLVSTRLMVHYRRHAILVIFFLAALITPSVDIFTLLLVAVPLCLLYEAGIWIARRVSPSPN